MGDTGPCGPSSEIFFDKGPAYGADGGPAFGGSERFVEIWNLVFMQFNRDAEGTLAPLPKTNIDTGAGLERIITTLNGQDSIFATEVYTGLLETAQSLTGRTYGADEATDVALRILADHGRAMTMLVADGVLPSNEGRGYVLRRIIRRAVMAARRAGAGDLITPRLVGASVASLGDAYPVLHHDLDLITDILQREEEGFGRTLRTGLTLLTEAMDATAGASTTLPGDIAFRLHDTHGFPIELTEELAAERSLAVDRPVFEALMAEQQERARASARQPRAADEGAYRAILDEHGPTVFVGRRASDLETSAGVIATLVGSDDMVEVFLGRSPFYAEGGGQVGDTGVIETPTGRAQVIDTVAVLPGLHAHRAKVSGEVLAGQQATASIDVERRKAIRRNHTATHLLHAALREVLGDHVRQQGSLVAPDRLRFDFAHHGPLTADELEAVLRRVNGQILVDDPVETTETSRREAEEMGAVAFFGDKYGESVRVVRSGSTSLEFCGGTHVDALGEIGQLQILSEASIGSNTRRIEAVTGVVAAERSLAQERLVARAAAMLKAEPDTLIEALERSFERTKLIEKERDQFRQAGRDAQVAELVDGIVGGALVAEVEQVSADDLRQMAQQLRDNNGLRAVVLGSVLGEKVAVAVATDESLDAKALVVEIGPCVGGGGGGSPVLAVAGGKKPEGLAAGLDLARQRLEGG